MTYMRHGSAPRSAFLQTTMGSENSLLVIPPVPQEARRILGSRAPCPREIVDALARPALLPHQLPRFES